MNSKRHKKVNDMFNFYSNKLNSNSLQFISYYDKVLKSLKVFQSN